MIGSDAGWRRGRMWALALAAGVAALLALTGSAQAAAPCPAGSDVWRGSTGGDWDTPGNWTAGVPTASTDVCLDNTDTAGSYTVDINDYGANQAVANSITIGGTAPNVVTLALVGVGGGVQVASPLTLTNASAGAVCGQYSDADESGSQSVGRSCNQKDLVSCGGKREFDVDLQVQIVAGFAVGGDSDLWSIHIARTAESAAITVINYGNIRLFDGAYDRHRDILLSRQFAREERDRA